MRITVSTLLVIVCLIFAQLPLGRKVSVMGLPDIIYVDDSNVSGPWNGTSAYPYENITSALENSASGDTIFVRSGIYYENIVVNQTIALVGESADQTVIDGSLNTTISVISIVGAAGASVRDFTITNSRDFTTSAVFLQGSTGVAISGNKITGNFNGIIISLSSDSVITNNIISDNLLGGINVLSSSGNIIQRNVISDNSNSGISLVSSNQNNITGNAVSSSFNGLSISSSTLNVVSLNNIVFNDVGIALQAQSDNNTIFHNNFTDTIQASSSNSVNFWSSNQEGNFWSDYNGRDENNDGIGDTPYSIVSGNQDNYPLMGAYFAFDVGYKGTTYDIAIISNSTVSVPILEIGAETGNRILHFNATGQSGTFGFSRIAVPTDLMASPYIVLIDSEETNVTTLGIPDQTHVHLYFSYPQGNRTVSIISSITLHLYYDLLNDFLSLNRTYFDLLNSYNFLVGNYTQLLEASAALNASYQQLLALNATYGDLLNSYVGLNSSYYTLLTLYHDLSVNFSQLEDRVLNSEQVQNTRNLTYIVAGLTAIYIVTTVYLSKRAHTRTRPKAKAFEEAER